VPHIKPEPINLEVYSTRAHIEASGVLGNTLPAPEAKWSCEYALAEPNGEPPPETSSSWIAAGGGTTTGNDHPTFACGASDATDDVVLHHLLPSPTPPSANPTTYYARFRLEDEGGVVEEEPDKPWKDFKFQTKPVEKPEVAKPIFGNTTFRVAAASPTSATATAQIETNGAETKYHFEYATKKELEEVKSEEEAHWIAFTALTKGTGVVSVSEDFAEPAATLTGLAPETSYCARVTASNEVGRMPSERQSVGGSGDGCFTTPTDKPVVFAPEVRNVTATSVYTLSSVNPHGFETEWRFEYITGKALEEAEQRKEPAKWTAVGGGTITQAEAEASPEGEPPTVEARLGNLEPATVYHVRVFAKSFTEGVNAFGEAISGEKQGTTNFETSGAPAASAFTTHALHGESVRLLGYVNPNSVPTSAEQTVTIEGAPSGGTFTIHFDGQTTAGIPFNAKAQEVNTAFNHLELGGGSVLVSGRRGGPYTVYFYGQFAEKPVPSMTADGSGLSPTETVAVATTQAGGEAYDTRYKFEYTAEKEGGVAKASFTPEEDGGVGNVAKYVGQDLSGLIPGESYRYRIVARNTSPGDPVVHGTEQTLTVPIPAAAGSEEACPNQALRIGASANLPDCRAYEQVTPVDKEGSHELFHYEGLAPPSYALVGEDGAHVMVNAPVTWDAGSGDNPYFLSREEGKGWQMTAGAPQPEAGLSIYTPQVFSPALTEMGFESKAGTSIGSAAENVDFRVGPPGGPYATVAIVPVKQQGAGWVAASGSFSKLILEVEDHKLVEPPTTTKSGTDLYEYSAGALRQVNVGIGRCGAVIATGNEETGGGGISGPHVVSTDGSRVFFEASPGNECSASRHLYMRVNGGSPSAETVDIGSYRFVAADSSASEVLVEKQSGANPGLYLYQPGSALRLLPATSPLVGTHFTVSEDLKEIYAESAAQLTPEAAPVSLTSGEQAINIYRYDLPTGTLRFVARAETDELVSHMSSDGRYYYFTSRSVAGLPGGAVVLGGGHETDHHLKPPAIPTMQVYRYDSSEHSIECVSCASPTDPEPKLGADFGNGSNGQSTARAGLPRLTLVSSNGDYAFFQTPAALVPSDVDGEVTPEGTGGLGIEHASTDNSLSGDVYEWRRDGVRGCARLQGCLALITNGRGGFLNLLLGTANEGNDVFVYTHSQLVSQDSDTAGDIYDVRIGGGFPLPPPGPVECEGSACQTPVSPPNDATPSSFTFTGPGNLLQSAPSKAAKAKKPKANKRKRKHGKKKRTGKKAERLSSGRGKTRTSGRHGR
jgi:hypothetical protein